MQITLPENVRAQIDRLSEILDSDPEDVIVGLLQDQLFDPCGKACNLRMAEATSKFLIEDRDQAQCASKKLEEYAVECTLTGNSQGLIVAEAKPWLDGYRVEFHYKGYTGWVRGAFPA